MAKLLSQIRESIKTRLDKNSLFFLAWLVRWAPWRFSRALARMLGAQAHWVSPRHFRRICTDVTRAFGDLYTPEEIEQIAHQSYVNLAEGLVEFFRLRCMSADEIRRWSRLENAEYIDKALARGRGAIMFTGHIGNWELCGTTVGLHSPIVVVTRAQSDTEITNFFTGIRETHGVTVIDMTDIRACRRALQRNECLGIVTDLNARVPGAFINFLGTPAATYAGVAYLARLTGAPVVPAFDERMPDGTHRTILRPPITMPNTDDKQHDLLIGTMRVQYVIQQEIRRRPADWYWLLQRWKTSPDDVVNPERIPMEHRDLTPEESATALADLAVDY